MQFPGRAVQRCRRRLHLLDKQSARHHRQAETPLSLIRATSVGRAGRRQPYPVGQPLQSRARYRSATAARQPAGPGLAPPPIRCALPRPRFWHRPPSVSTGRQPAPSLRPQSRSRTRSRMRRAWRAPPACNRDHRQGRRDHFRPVAALRRARRCHHEGQRAERDQGVEDRPEAGHPGLCLFEQGAGIRAENCGRQDLEWHQTRPAGQCTGQGGRAAAAAEAQGRQVRRAGGCVGRREPAEGRQIRPASGFGRAQGGSRHLHRPAGRYALGHRQKDRRRRRRAEAGERHAGRRCSRSARR